MDPSSTEAKMPEAAAKKNRYRDDPEYRRRLLERMRERYRNDPEYRRRIIERTKVYSVVNKGKISERNGNYRRNMTKERKEDQRRKRREYYLKNRDGIISRSRAWLRDNRERNMANCAEYLRRNRGEINSRRRARYRANAKRILERAKKIYWSRPEEMRAKKREDYQRHIDKRRARDRERGKTPNRLRQAREQYWSHRDERKAAFRESVRSKVAKAKELFGSKCGWCGYSKYPEILEFDHIIPLKINSRVRKTRDRNVSVLIDPSRFQLLCPNCHAVKTTLEKMSRATNLRWQAKRLRAKFKQIQIFGGKCRFCGFCEAPFAFEFDHIKPIRNASITRNSLYEVGKAPFLFQLLCANCHQLKTLQEMSEWRRQG